MASVSLGDFFVGAASSLAAGLLILALTHLDDVRYLISSAHRYRDLEGEWHHYNLTADSKRQPRPFWSAHEAVLGVTSFGHVRGVSKGIGTPNRGYRVGGAIRHGIMQLRLTNLDAVELSASFIYPKLLSRDVLVGVWVGQNYDGNVFAGPAVLSRAERTGSELTELVRSERLLDAGGEDPIPMQLDSPPG